MPGDISAWPKAVASGWKIAISVLKSSAMLFDKAGRRIPKPRPVQPFEEPIKWVDTARYVGVIFHTRFNWSNHIDQMRMKAAQRLGVLGTLVYRWSGLSIRNEVLLYKHLIRPMMEYVCPVWRSATRRHIRKLQVLQSKCLRIATNAPWYTGNKQIHDDFLSLPTTSDLWEIRLKVSWCGETFGYAARQISTLTERWPGSPKTGTSVSTTCPGYPQKVAMSSHLFVPTSYFSTTTLTEVFSGLLPSVVRQMPGYNTQRRCTARSFPTRRLNIIAMSLMLTLNMTFLGSNPRKPSSQSYAPA